MSIRIIKPGLLTTLVDEGRSGFRSSGIGPGGAMDRFGLAVANNLVGNDERTATLEIHFPAPEIMFDDDHLVAVAGKGMGILLNDKAAPLWKPLYVNRGCRMRFEKTLSGARVYLAVHGGWKAHRWLGSFTTNAGVHAGGYFGRALQKEDVVEAMAESVDPGAVNPTSWSVSSLELNKVYLPANQVRCITGPEFDLLLPASRETILSASFTIAHQSNRMGYRLEGPPLLLARPIELVSSPVDFGTIQLLPDGNLIILMADHQTTGGYPRIGSVLKADLPKLAQLNPGDKLSFDRVTFSEAEIELLSREKQLQELRDSCLLQFKKIFSG